MSGKVKAVFDCNVFLQALASPDGPAGRCVELALNNQIVLYISSQVLEEIREVTMRPALIARFKLREERVNALLENLPRIAVMFATVPESWQYSRDPDDAHYVNLALAADARLIVSRDKDLLDLMNDSNPDGRELRKQNPGFTIVTPPQFLAHFPA